VDPIAGREIAEKLIELNTKSRTTLIVASHGSFPYARATSRVVFFTIFVNKETIIAELATNQNAKSYLLSALFVESGKHQ
jgi:energy-coupling factor transporter ATP-binding protein EcfA2